MAMDKDRLGDAIVDTILAINPIAPSASEETTLRTFWKAIASEIIDEIKDNMDITTTVSIPNAQSGATTLPGTGVDSTIT